MKSGRRRDDYCGSFALDVTLKAVLLCLAASAAIRLGRKASATVRHDLAAATLICCGLLPLLSALPRITGPVSDIAPIHRAANAVATALPPDAAARGVAVVDRIWSGDGSSSLPGWLGAALAAIWASGFLVSLFVCVRDHRAAGGVARRGSPFPHVEAKGVPVLSTTELRSPALFGCRSPLILLPREAHHWPVERLRSVLAHELAHVERRDCATEWVVQIVCALHWYNPFVLNLAHRLRAEREVACDDRALATGLDRRDYAETLVRIARDAHEFVPRPLLAMARPPELERRVRKILSHRRQRLLPGWSRIMVAGAVVVAFVPAAALTAPAAGVLGAGSVQPEGGPLIGLDDPMSELVPAPYAAMAQSAAAVPAAGPDGGAVAALKVHFDRRSRGHGDLVRQRAIWTLVQVRGGRLFEPLAEKVGDRDWRIRAYAAWGLAATDGRRATPLLVRLLDDPVWRVRAMAVDSLAKLADPEAADAMAKALRDPAWQVRYGAIEYVSRQGTPKLMRHLQPLLRDPHTATRLTAQEIFYQN
jgi:beta-lactamase regulating signal transducer with metallopeptidase domain